MTTDSYLKSSQISLSTTINHAGSKPYNLVGYQDQTLIDTLLDGPIATAVQTTEAFLFYSSGNHVSLG